jgi:hypothetical protein
MLTPNEWHDMKVPQKEFEKLQPEAELEAYANGSAALR